MSMKRFATVFNLPMRSFATVFNLPMMKFATVCEDEEIWDCYHVSMKRFATVFKFGTVFICR